MGHLTLTALRQQLFKIVDKVIQTGVPVEIERPELANGEDELVPAE